MRDSRLWRSWSEASAAAWTGHRPGAATAGRQHAALAERVETSGETVFFYLREPKRLLDALALDHSIRYLHRPANLEDLFLKLTGRQIRDDA